MNPFEAKQQQLEELNARVRMWQDVQMKEGWKVLMTWLEGKYLTLGEETPDSLRKLGERNAQMKLIKELFTFVQHDFALRDALTQELHSISVWNDELPSPQGSF